MAYRLTCLPHYFSPTNTLTCWAMVMPWAAGTCALSSIPSSLSAAWIGAEAGLRLPLRADSFLYYELVPKPELCCFYCLRWPLTWCFACCLVFWDLSWQIILSSLYSWPHFLFVYLLPPDPDLYVSDPGPVMALGNETPNPECFFCLMTCLGILKLGHRFDPDSSINSAGVNSGQNWLV